ELLKQIYRWPQVLPDRQHILHSVLNSSGVRHARVVRFGDPDSARDLIEADSRVLYTASAVTPDRGYLIYIRAGSLLAHPFDLRSMRVTEQAAQIAPKVFSFQPTGAADF